ncbi:MAG: type VI secretion system-associated protein TagF [Methylococcales bacterium]|nr:type VI secretion system-associated protein TagF [Methylococcales bacterium]
MNTITGFYGKLPIIGDFVSRRLPNEFISPWDNWLQAALAASREELGDDWLNRYLTSPIWRFLLSPGVCGDKAVAGIVMPSVDRVGRYFPMTVAVVFEQSPQLPFLFTAGSVWFEQLEDAALTGLEGNMDINAFDQLIQSIPVFSVPTNSSPNQQSSEKKSFYTAIENSGQINNAFVGLNTKLLARFMSGYSLWTNEGSQHVQAALLACEGLPPISSFTDFLTDRVSSKNYFTPSELALELLANSPNSANVTIADQEQPSLSSILASNKSALSESCWHSWAITNTGKRRKHNEDSLLDKPEASLWVVADGMGGHKAGDVASQLIVNTLKNLLPTEPLENYIKEVEQSLQNVNTQLRKLAAREYDNHLVGSTVVVLICEDQRCAFIWAGDSRLYRLRDHKLQQLSQDHSADNAPISSAWSVKSSNIITRAIGADDHLELDVEVTEVLEGDVFLLCSDGLDKEMSFQEIEHIMQIKGHSEIADTLINETLARGARDNVTVIIVSRESIS